MEQQPNSLQMFVDFRKRAVRLNYILLVIVILAMIAVIVVGSREDKVIVLDGNGKPYVALTFKDNVYPVEAQNFVRDALQVTLEWTYTEILEGEKRKEHLQKMHRYFHPDYFPDFITGFRNSDYIASIRDEKKITKVAFPNAFNIYKDRQRDVFVATGTVTVTAYDTNGEITSDRKTYRLEMVRGVRSVFNPYGLYTIGLTEVFKNAE